MLTESDGKKMAAAIFEGQESAYSLNRAIVVSDPTLASRHVQTILHSFSTCDSVLNSHSQSSSPPSNKKRNGFGKEETLILDSPTLIIDGDGFYWKKYGQRPIKNYHHPRSYYGCLGRNCEAKKHVQKTQDSPPNFRTTYAGLHNCLPDLSFDPAANESTTSMMLRFDQHSLTHCIHDQTPIPLSVPVPAVPVMNHECCDGQEYLINNDDYWGF